MTMLSEADVMDLIDLMAEQRYNVSGIDFLCAFSEGTAEDKYPGCHDMIVLAEALPE